MSTSLTFDCLIYRIPRCKILSMFQGRHLFRGGRRRGWLVMDSYLGKAGHKYPPLFNSHNPDCFDFLNTYESRWVFSLATVHVEVVDVHSAAFNPEPPWLQEVTKTSRGNNRGVLRRSLEWTLTRTQTCGLWSWDLSGSAALCAFCIQHDNVAFGWLCFSQNSAHCTLWQNRFQRTPPPPPPKKKQTSVLTVSQMFETSFWITDWQVPGVNGYMLSGFLSCNRSNNK